MKVKIIILFVLIGVSLVGWTFFGIQRLMTPETSMTEVERAFPQDSYQFFLKSNKLTLYALKPERQTEGAENFRGYGVLGKTEIDTVQHQKELKGAFIRGMAGAKPAPCFNPRHGLRAANDEGKTIDLIISFECEKFAVYWGDSQSESGVNAKDLENPFNQILRNAQIETGK
jgi:hypothetical protein